MVSHHSFAQKKPLRIGRWIALLIIIVIIRLGVSLTRPIVVHDNVIVKKGDNLNVFLSHLTGSEKLKLRVYIKTHTIDLGNIQLGTYQFSGSYAPAKFLEVIKAGPTLTHIRMTVLEGWSIYDIDAAMTKQGIIQKGDYIAYVSSGTLINRMGEKYPYIGEAYKLHAFPSLEGWLYPDTYFLDPQRDDPVAQLVNLQLQTFDTKIHLPFASAITAFPSLLQAKGVKLSYDMDLWNILRLASVIEKEERNNQNKPTVAGIFFNRLAQGTTLGADITLCYGLHEGYETCTPSLINQHIADTENPYNTRVQRGLPPTPIANPSVDTVRSVLEFTKTNYFFYLHDSQGVIHYAENIQGHNDNISKYLK